MSQGQSSREPIILALSVMDHRQSDSGPTSDSGPNIKVAQGQLVQSQLSQGQVDSEQIEPGARRANLSRKAKQKQGKKQQQATGSLRCEREAQRKRRHLTLPLRVAHVCVCTSPTYLERSTICFWAKQSEARVSDEPLALNGWIFCRSAPFCLGRTLLFSAFPI